MHLRAGRFGRVACFSWFEMIASSQFLALAKNAQMHVYALPPYRPCYWLGFISTQVFWSLSRISRKPSEKKTFFTISHLRLSYNYSRARVGKFACTVDIHNGVSGHVETVVHLINQNAKAKHHVNIGVDAEDYYKIKDSEKESKWMGLCFSALSW